MIFQNHDRTAEFNLFAHVICFIYLFIINYYYLFIYLLLLFIIIILLSSFKIFTKTLRVNYFQHKTNYSNKCNNIDKKKQNVV